MENPIKKNSATVLITLVEKDIRRYIQNITIKEITGMEPDELNDAINYLEGIGAIKVLRALGTAPYRFHSVEITTRGRYLYHELTKEIEENMTEMKQQLPSTPLNPVGSPYGFDEFDWEFVSLKMRDKNTIYISLGLQYESEYYETDGLMKNLEKHLNESVNRYNIKNPGEEVKLQFSKLSGGFAEHLFNNIARQIIGSDIVFFEISDENPNVMIELGVALTWGIRFQPIRDQSSKPSISDIGGQYSAKYKNSGKIFLEELFEQRIDYMIERAIKKKAHYE